MTGCVCVNDFEIFCDDYNDNNDSVDDMLIIIIIIMITAVAP